MPASLGSLTEIAAVLRDAYIRERRAFETKRSGRESRYQPSAYWEGGCDGFRRGRTNIWRRLAAHVLRHGADPIAYVAAQFRQVKFSPQPNMLLSQRALERYRQWKESAQTPRQLRLALRSEIEALEAAVQVEQQRSPDWDRATCLRAVLVNPRVAISPLLRYVVAFRAGWADLVESVRESARWQYWTASQAYAEAWGELLPPVAVARIADRAG